MTCKRCEDIHTAQREGKTLEACKCKCHDKGDNTDTTLWDGGTATGTLYFNTFTTADTNTLTTGTATTLSTTDTTFDISGNQLTVTTTIEDLNNTNTQGNREKCQQ